MLDQLAAQLGGRGCIVKDGYVIKTWGDQAERGDWASSAKPVLSTMLFFALKEGLVKSVDQPLSDFWEGLKEKDRTITFRHLGSMTSGYARPEGPGEAWAYNDFAIQFYQKTLFDKVFKGDAKAVAEDPKRLGALGFQDGLKFTDRRRLSASVRDFARIAWFWANKGKWGKHQLLPESWFDEYMRPQVPYYLPVSAEADTDDYLEIGTYGGGSSHFSVCGPGIYGFNWWLNGTGGTHPRRMNWPDAPPDTVMTIGVRGNCSMMIPSLGIVLASGDGDWGELEPGNRDTKMNRAAKLLAGAAGYKQPAADVTGTMRKLQPVALSFWGPATSEQGNPNPFTDYRLIVTFICDKSRFVVPGYFAADGNAGESGSDSGNIWRAHLTPDREGTWSYSVSFRTGPGVAIESAPNAGEPCGFDGAAGSFRIGPADPQASGFLSKGMLCHNGERYLWFAETGEYYLKGGADSPENLLAFADFDQTRPTHKYEPHLADWKIGDPFWKGDKGKGLIGALNYLSGKGMNSVYFLTMNVEGDGNDVWPWNDNEERYRFDCSKLDQWETLFSHMDRVGLALHVVTQEQENDQLLDNGELGPERKLYYRELIARFGHHPALIWNLGEENTNSDAQRKAFAEYIRALDLYDHPIVVHTFPDQWDNVYRPLLGFSCFDGPSLQIDNMKKTHAQTLKWVKESQTSGHPWFVCLDEIGPPDIGVKPDTEDPEHSEVRRYALWGNLMAGGAGVEWFFQNDIGCEDWRTRDRMWDQTKYALDFFAKYLPFPEMESRDEAIVSGEGYCLVKKGLFAVYTPDAAACRLRLPRGAYKTFWFNPRIGGEPIPGADVRGGNGIALGTSPKEEAGDWVVLLRRK